MQHRSHHRQPYHHPHAPHHDQSWLPVRAEHEVRRGCQVAGGVVRACPEPLAHPGKVLEIMDLQGRRHSMGEGKDAKAGFMNLQEAGPQHRGRHSLAFDCGLCCYLLRCYVVPLSAAACVAVCSSCRRILLLLDSDAAATSADGGCCWTSWHPT